MTKQTAKPWTQPSFHLKEDSINGVGRRNEITPEEKLL